MCDVSRSRQVVTNHVAGLEPRSGDIDGDTAASGCGVEPRSRVAGQGFDEAGEQRGVHAAGQFGVLASEWWKPSILCMSERGERANGTRTVTSALYGLLRENPAASQEFLQLTRNSA
jgi:hypothetical protein